MALDGVLRHGLVVQRRALADELLANAMARQLRLAVDRARRREPPLRPQSRFAIAAASASLITEAPQRLPASRGRAVMNRLREAASALPANAPDLRKESAARHGCGSPTFAGHAAQLLKGSSRSRQGISRTPTTDPSPGPPGSP